MIYYLTQNFYLNYLNKSMDYSYNNRDLLKNPQKYMYTKFEGKSFFDAFFSNRLTFINNYIPEIKCPPNPLFDISFKIVKKEFSNSSLTSFYSNFQEEEIKQFKKTADSSNIIAKEFKIVNDTNIDRRIKTSTLIGELIYTMHLENQNNKKFWIDKLVQRFEVTKKLFEYYEPGFRKGMGDKEIIFLYFWFAILSSLFYLKTTNLKYLNTLLKLCDILTSLQMSKLLSDISSIEIRMLLFLEMTFIKKLLDTKIR